jgi:hypothetical protein
MGATTYSGFNKSKLAPAHLPVDLHGHIGGRLMDDDMKKNVLQPKYNTFIRK